MAVAAQKLLAQGCHRTCLPEQTLARMQPHLQAMGITRIANITGLDNIGIAVITVCRPNSKAVAVAQGKGLSLSAAKASGLMEAIETYHGEQIDLPLRLASYRTLKTNAGVVDVQQLPQLSLNRFDQDLSMLWIEGVDYLTKQPFYVPFEMVHCNYSLPFPVGSGAFMMSTNGLASGNVALEAISHGLCELIERDATTLWQLQRKHQPLYQQHHRLDLSTVHDPEPLQLLQLFEQAGIYVSVWDITSDLGIATFYCTIINQHREAFRPLYPASGIGTHPSKASALVRALTEAAQTRLTLISGSRDDVTAKQYRHAQNGERHQQLLNQLTQTQQTRDYSQIPSWHHQTIEQDMALLTKQLSARGMEQVIVVDLTKAEFAIPVVRVIVPGLEGIGNIPGYQPGPRAKQLLANSPAAINGH